MKTMNDERLRVLASRSFFGTAALALISCGLKLVQGNFMWAGDEMLIGVLAVTLALTLRSKSVPDDPDGDDAEPPDDFCPEATQPRLGQRV